MQNAGGDAGLRKTPCLAGGDVQADTSVLDSHLAGPGLTEVHMSSPRPCNSPRILFLKETLTYLHQVTYTGYSSRVLGRLEAGPVWVPGGEGAKKCGGQTLWNARQSLAA